MNDPYPFVGGRREGSGSGKDRVCTETTICNLRTSSKPSRAIYHLSVNVAQKEKMSLCNEKSESWSDKQLCGELCAEFTQTPTIVQGEEINDSTKISH